MERRTTVKFPLLCILVLTPGLALAEQRSMVLVTSIEARIHDLSFKEVRRLYLGMQILHDGSPIRPLRNLEDPLLEEVFLQKIVFLSARSYENQLLSRVFRLGGLRPVTYRTKARLKQALQASSNAVTYMWEVDVLNDKNLKKIGDLWSGEVD